MKTALNQFFQSLTERLTGLLASLISTRFQNMQAVDLAEQQSELEERARRYDEEGKPAIAAALRERIQALASPNLADSGRRMIDAVTDVPPRLADDRSAPQEPTTFPDPSLLAPPKPPRELKANDCASKRKPTGGDA
jgi:hypothetical protein